MTGKLAFFGGTMNFGVTARAVFAGALAAQISVSSSGQGLPPGITPSMVQEVQSMTPAQQQALAKQYGLSLPQSQEATSGSDTNLGDAGEPLEQVSDDRSELKTQNAVKSDDLSSLRYGRYIFDQKVSTFAPTDDAPIPSDYRLGVGDQLVVQLFGKENAQYTLVVGRDGNINFPKLGGITLAGLTFEDAQGLIKTRVTQQLIGVESVVTLGRLRAINIFMSGEVSVPGAFSVSALTTISQALYQAGGVTAIGSLRNIQVLRRGEVVSRFDIYDLLMRGDVTGDIRLQSGDVIFVPTIDSVVEVRGEVRRPMAYELLGKETIADLIEMSGGFTKEAFLDLATLVRTSLKGGLPRVQSLNLLATDAQKLTLRNGDILEVPSTGGSLANTVSIQGAVYRSGLVGWKPGFRVSDIVKSADRDLMPVADLSYSLLVRVKNQLLDIEVLQFSLINSLVNPSGEGDPELRVGDKILVFSAPDLESSAPSAYSRSELLRPVLSKLGLQAREGEPRLTASIQGAVKAPGEYPIMPGYRVGDLVRAAGGLNDSAFLDSAELRSIVEIASGNVESSYTEVDLNSAMLSGGGPILRSRDSLTVRDIPDWAPTESVVVEGEVRFPGTYRIAKGERLSDIVRRAGGLTEKAASEAAVFTRKSIARQELERSRQFARDIQQSFATRLLTQERASQGISDVAMVISALQEAKSEGRLLIDLDLALSGNSSYDLEVEDGDVLTIPQSSNTVAVVGEVQRSGTHTFQRELRLEDYLDLSAGLTQRADKKNIYIVKANGSIVSIRPGLWRFSDNGESLDPGDTIVVPINTEYQEVLASWQEITQIVYQSMVSVAAVLSL